MPFQSEKQRKYLWANEPAIAREWTDKYGSRVKKETGGILNTNDPMFSGLGQLDNVLSFASPFATYFTGGNWAPRTKGMDASLQSIIANQGTQSGTIGYSDYDKSQAAGAAMPDLTSAFKDVFTGKLSPQEFANMTTLGRLNYDINPDGTINWGSNKYNFRPEVAQDTGIFSNWANKTNRAIEPNITMKRANEISPAGLGDLIQRRPQAGQRRSGIPRRDTWNVKRPVTRTDQDAGTVEHDVWGGPLEEYDERFDLNQKYRDWMNEKIKNTKTYSEFDIIPNEKYEGLEIQRDYIPTGELPLHIGPYKKHSGSASTEPIYKTIGFNQDGSKVMTKEEYDNLNLDEEETFIDPNRIPGRIQKSVPRKMGMLERFRNRFYKPAAGAVNYGGKTYSPAQLNSMNALGGYYSEPARQQRRLDARRTNILNRAAKGKPVGNVNKLLGKYGYKGTPGGGIQFTGRSEGSSTAGAGYSRSDSGWSSSPFRKGGLATLWPR